MATTLKIKNTFVTASLLFSLCCLLIVFFGAFYFSNKGFELSDETYYLYFSNHHNPETFIVSNFGLLNDFFCFGKPSLINLRVAKIIYQTLAVLFFCFAMFRFFDFKGFQTSLKEKVFVAAIALMLSYCNYDYLPMTLSYNTWTFILSLCVFGIFFLELINALKWRSLVYSILLGVLFFELLIVKFPAGVILSFFYFLINIILIKKYFLLKVLSAFIGLGLGYIIFLNDFDYLLHIVDNYFITLFEVKHTAANSYWLQIRDFWGLCVEKNYVLIELIVFMFAIIFKKNQWTYRKAFSYLLLIINLSFSFWFIKGNGEALYNDFLTGTIFFLNTFFYMYMFGAIRIVFKENKDVLLMAFLLFITPFCLMIGTNNDFYYTVSHTMLFAVMAILFLNVFYKVSWTAFLSLTSVFVCVFILGILYNGAVKFPYRQNDLTKKHYELNFSDEIKGVQESYERFVDYHVLSNLIKTHNTNKEPIVTFFNHFGLYYIANNDVFPESQISDGERYVYINDYMLERFKFNDRFDLIVVPETVEKSEKMRALFEKYGVALNGNYKVVVDYKFLSTGEKVFIYKHI